MFGSMDASEDKHVALGLLFLRHVSVSFQRLHEQLSADEVPDPGHRDDYGAENIFWVPDEARWRTLSVQSKDPGTRVKVDTDPALFEWTPLPGFPAGGRRVRCRAGSGVVFPMRSSGRRRIAPGRLG